MTSQSDLLTRDEAAAYLRVKPRTLTDWARLNRGPNRYKCAGKVLYRKDDLDQYLERLRDADKGNA